MRVSKVPVLKELSSFFRRMKDTLSSSQQSDLLRLIHDYGSADSRAEHLKKVFTTDQENLLLKANGEFGPGVLLRNLANLVTPDRRDLYTSSIREAFETVPDTLDYFFGKEGRWTEFTKKVTEVGKFGKALTKKFETLKTNYFQAHPEQN